MMAWLTGMMLVAAAAPVSVPDGATAMRWEPRFGTGEDGALLVVVSAVQKVDGVRAAARTEHDFSMLAKSLGYDVRPAEASDLELPALSVSQILDEDADLRKLQVKVEPEISMPISMLYLKLELEAKEAQSAPQRLFTRRLRGAMHPCARLFMAELFDGSATDELS